MKLSEALTAAIKFWSTRSGAKVMECRASVCVEILGANHALSKLDSSHGRRLLIGLAGRGLSRKSQGDYYAAFKRLIALNNGPSTAAWPRAPEPERRTRDAMGSDDAHRVIQRLRALDYPNTADWGLLLYATGVRGGIEGLRPGAMREDGQGDGYVLLHVTGKGGHERVIPVTDIDARALLASPERLKAIYRTPYCTHLARWKRATNLEGVKSRLATPHSLRHNYATRVLKQSGGNLKLVQELLGHASPGTTARYASVDTQDKVKALRG